MRLRVLRPVASAVSRQEKDRMISELRMALADGEQAREATTRSSAEREAFWEAKTREMREEMEVMRWASGEAVRKQRAAEERLRLECSAKVREAIEYGEAARRELASVLDEAAQRREAEGRCRDEAALEARRVAEQQAEALERRLEALKQAKAETEADAEMARAKARDLDQQLQNERWERDDSSRRNEARLAELEERLSRARMRADRADDEARSTRAAAAAKLQSAERDASAARREADEARCRMSEVEHRLDAVSAEWDAKVVELNKQLGNERKDAQRNIEKTAAELAQARTVCENLRSENVDLSARLEDAHAEIVAVKAALNQLRSAVAQAQDERVALEDRALVAARTKDARIAQLGRELHAAKMLAPPPPPLPPALPPLEPQPSLTDRVEAAIEGAGLLSSPVFSEDEGGASVLLSGLDPDQTVKDDSRQAVAAMRAELEAIKDDALRKADERDAELRAAKRETAKLRAAKKADSEDFVARIDRLERDLSAANRRLANLATERNQLMHISNALRAQIRRAERRDDRPLSSLRAQLRDRAQQTEVPPHRDSDESADEIPASYSDMNAPARAAPRGRRGLTVASHHANKLTTSKTAKRKIRNYNIVDDDEAAAGAFR